LDPAPPPPKDNPLTPAKIALGRKLFFDPILSRDGSLSCASCHLPEHAFSGTTPVAVGIDGLKGRRNAPTLQNRVYGRTQFWDGRATTLEEQALQPIENPRELGTTVDAALQRLKADADYARSFSEVFKEGVTSRNLARAIASFERSLLSGDSRVDRFRAGDFSALSDSERQGLWLFESRGQCWRCHSGRNFSDEAFRNTGVSWGGDPVDLGRFEVTGKDGDRGKFKTPTLRNVSLTAPYMHDGSLDSLKEVVEFYNRGGGGNARLDPLMKPLELSQADIENLTAFLKALAGQPE